MTRKYSEETKAAVVAALLTGQSVSQVAKQYEIPRGTVAAWSTREAAHQTFAAEKKERIGELLVAYLSTSLETLEAQARMFKDEGWLRKQNAADVAVLHGVVTDKAIRLLEALANSDQ